MSPETIEQRMRRWLLEEATRNGSEVHTTSEPSSVQRWPLGTIDAAYWEVNDCD